MASTQRIIWTALPAGIRGDTLTVRLHVAPRLTGGDPPTLKSFPDFWDWPTTLAGYQVRAEISGVTAPIPLTLTSDASSELWTALFPEQSKVTPFEFTDMALHPVNSFAVSKIADALQKTYGTVAANPASAVVPPKTRTVADAAWQYVDPDEAPGRFKPSKTAPATNANVAKLRKFFEPYPGGPFPNFDPPAPDFHNAVAALANYPSLPPLFGLVRTYEFKVPYKMPSTGTIRLVVTRGPDVTDGVSRTEVCPRTAFQFKRATSASAAHFRTAPRPTKPEISGGKMVMRLSAKAQAVTPWYNAPTSLLQFDVEGGAVKMATSGKASIGAVTAAAKGVKDTPKQATLPALTTTGIRLVRNARATALKTQFGTAKALNTKAAKPAAPTGGFGADMKLYAEDVTRGWAIDVYDESKAHWFKLSARDARYSVPGHEPLPGIDGWFSEEAFVTTAVTQAPVAADATPPPTAPVNLHEGLFTWDGWSLAMQRPGTAILGLEANLDSPVDSEAAADERGYALGQYVLPDFPLSKEFRVPPGSLPRLRFGVAYRIRARSVDISGYADPFVDAKPSSTDLTVSLPLRYRRFEPVPAPPLIPTAPYGPGESAYHLVVRSDIGGPVDGPARRHVMPPRTTENTAELHGGFDLPSGPPDPAAWQVIAAREKAAAGFSLDENGDGTAAPRAEIPDPVPYLPDPVAAGAAFWNLPGTVKVTSGEVAFAEPGASRAGLTVTGVGNLTTTKVDFDLPDVPRPDLPGKSWLHKRPFALEAVGVDSTDPRVAAYGEPYDTLTAPKWDADERVLAVGVPRGEQVVVTMSTFSGKITPDRAGISWDFGLMGVYYWAWAKLSGHTALSTMLGTLSRMGANWLVSPFRTLTLTHAVQRPLIPPRWSKPSLLTRVTGQTWVELRDYQEVHAPSTAKLDVYAEWEDTVDDPSDGQPHDGRGDPVRPRVARSQHAFEVPIVPGQKIVLDPQWAVMGPKPKVKNLPRPTAAQWVLINALALRQRHYIGDTRYRMMRYRAVSTTRYKEFFPPDAGPFTRTSGDAGGDVLAELKVLSTARPDAPKLRWIVPSFGWDRSADGSRSVRSGGLRVFLDRPWYSSGDGELLGVVFWKPGSLTGLKRLEPYLSYTAHDPIWRGGTLGTLLSATDFPLRVKTGTGLYLDETGPDPYQVHVSGHAVQYDAERDLYFADIRIDPHKDYWPFARLALCRYQPDSIARCELSRVVVADFAQLAPNRTAQLVYGSNHATVAISVTGATFSASSISMVSHMTVDDRARITVTVEGTDQPSSDDPRSWVPLSGPLDMPRTSYSGGMAAWSRTLTFQQLGLPPKAAYRLAVREYEPFAHHEVANGATTYSQTERLVYAETLPLTPPLLQI